MKDIFGKALLDYFNKNYTEDIITWTNISKEDNLPLPYLFRNFSEMPKIEQVALQLCKGKTLDVGCGAGNHSLYLQQQGMTVKAIDTSKGAITMCKKRGVQHAKHQALLDETERFNTILLLMNGTGIFQEFAKVKQYLKHLKSLLLPDGQILIDSSDIRYMYSSEVENENDTEVEALNQLNNGNYYGELDYCFSYKGETEQPLKWLYLDFETLEALSNSVGLTCEKVIDGEHYDYLARITL